MVLMCNLCAAFIVSMNCLVRVWRSFTIVPGPAGNLVVVVAAAALLGSVPGADRSEAHCRVSSSRTKSS